MASKSIIELDELSGPLVPDTVFAVADPTLPEAMKAWKATVVALGAAMFYHLDGRFMSAGSVQIVEPDWTVPGLPLAADGTNKVVVPWLADYNSVHVGFLLHFTDVAGYAHVLDKYIEPGGRKFELDTIIPSGLQPWEWSPPAIRIPASGNSITVDHLGVTFTDIVAADQIFVSSIAAYPGDTQVSITHPVRAEALTVGSVPDAAPGGISCETLTCDTLRVQQDIRVTSLQNSLGDTAIIIDEDDGAITTFIGLASIHAVNNDPSGQVWVPHVPSPLTQQWAAYVKFDQLDIQNMIDVDYDTTYLGTKFLLLHPGIYYTSISLTWDDLLGSELVDYSTVISRISACGQEVALNKFVSKGIRGVGDWKLPFDLSATFVYTGTGSNVVYYQFLNYSGGNLVLSPNRVKASIVQLSGTTALT